MSRSICLIAALVAVPCLSFAGPMLETANYARFYGPTDPSAFYACVKTSGVACDGAIKAPGTNWTVNYYSQGTAAFGVLRDSASVFLTGDGSLGAFPSIESTGARSGYRDTYTISGGTGSGVVNFSFAVTGTASRTPGAGAGALFQYVPVVAGNEDFGHAMDYTVIDGAATVPVPFTFDEVNEFVIYFYALAQVFSWRDGASAVADYSHTAILDRISVSDSFGADVPNFSIAAGSGTHYSANGVLPEPSTSLLLLAAFAAAVGGKLGGKSKRPIDPALEEDGLLRHAAGIDHLGRGQGCGR